MIIEFLSSFIGFITVVGGAVGIYILYKYVGAKSVMSSLDQKDSAIDTYKQMHDASTERIEQLEHKFDLMQNEIVNLEKENSELKAKIEVLEKYSAPEAIERFEKQQSAIIEILKSIENRMSNV